MYVTCYRHALRALKRLGFTDKVKVLVSQKHTCATLIGKAVSLRDAFAQWPVVEPIAHMLLDEAARAYPRMQKTIDQLKT